MFYSLGNFIFDTDYQRIQSYTDMGMLIKLHLNEDHYSWDFLSVKNDRETLKISKCAAPAIFRNINSFEYGILWPLAAKHLLKNERRKNTFHHPEYADRSWLDWLLKFDLKKCKNEPGREVIIGRILSALCLWRFADKKVVNYIREKQEEI